MWNGQEFGCRRMLENAGFGLVGDKNLIFLINQIFTVWYARMKFLSNPQQWYPSKFIFNDVIFYHRRKIDYIIYILSFIYVTNRARWDTWDIWYVPDVNIVCHVINVKIIPDLKFKSWTCGLWNSLLNWITLIFGIARAISWFGVALCKNFQALERLLSSFLKDFKYSNNSKKLTIDKEMKD